MMEQANRTWHDKAKLIIGELCTESFNQANRLPNGRLRKKHVQYSVPSRAQELLECLKHDDEVRAKSLFMLFHCSPDSMHD